MCLTNAKKKRKAEITVFHSCRVRVVVVMDVNKSDVLSNCAEVARDLRALHVTVKAVTSLSQDTSWPKSHQSVNATRPHHMQ